MKILTVENKTYELDDIPDTIDDLRYSILDYSNPGHIDYYFIPFNPPNIFLLYTHQMFYVFIVLL